MAIATRRARRYPPHMSKPQTYDTVILGAGAAGLMAAGRCGGRVLAVDHARRAGEKIRISGGGRCNFTNIHCEPGNFLGQNAHFHKSALARFTPWDFVSLVSEHGIAWHEKTLGQLFCDGKATQIVEMLTGLARRAGAEISLETEVTAVEDAAPGHRITLERSGQRSTVLARNLIVATGGKSIPKMGATGLAYDIAAQRGMAVTETRPALVPFTFSEGRFAPLSGVSLPVRAHACPPQGPSQAFDEAALFTHRGLSGPAMLQISSYWREGQEISLNLAPPGLFAALRDQRQREGRRNLTTELARHLPARLVEHLAAELAPALDLSGNLADQSDARLKELCAALSDWRLRPSGTEGYRTAEVTLGGIATDGVSSKTMMSNTAQGLYFIGECLDVTGWLGGFNFQWAWASAHAAAEAIRA